MDNSQFNRPLLNSPHGRGVEMENDELPISIIERLRGNDVIYVRDYVIYDQDDCSSFSARLN